MSIFSNDANAQTVTRLLAEGYMNAAEGAGERALSSSSFDTLLPCPIETADDACIGAFIDDFGARAFRRPLDDDDRADLRAAFDAGRAEGDARSGFASVIEVALQSPEYLYRVELGADGASPPSPPTLAVPVATFELASRLSYLFWGTMPDAALFAAAQSGQLSTADGVRAQAARLLADPQTRVTFASFYQEFLELDQLDDLEKDPSIYPTYEPAIRTAFRGETLTFIDSVLWSGDARLSTLLTAPYTFVNGKLAAFYGIAAGRRHQAFQRVDARSQQRRGGLLTQGAFLATHAKSNQTSPVHRGKFVRERLLCTTPAAAARRTWQIRPPSLDPRLTTRERFAQHSTDPFCAGCHHLMDPIGLGFESFDGVGRWRDTESDRRSTARASSPRPTSTGRSTARATWAAPGRAAPRCEPAPSNQWFRFGYGRADSPRPTPARSTARARLPAAGGNLRELLIALTQTDAFRYRTVEPTP